MMTSLLLLQKSENM